MTTQLLALVLAAATVALPAAAGDPFDPIDCVDWSFDDWPRARIEFQPGLALLRSRWPLCALHATRHQERSEIDVDLEQGGECVLVFRRGFEVAVEAVPSREADAIEAFRAGATLAKVSDRLARDATRNADVVELFQRWVSAALIDSVSLAETAA